MKASPAEFQKLDLRAHSLLADVPLHDVWSLDLPGGKPELTMSEFRSMISVADLTASNAAVRFLFRLRGALGNLFGWDREQPDLARSSYIEKLTEADRAASFVEPGTPDAPFRLLLVREQEAISEIHNSTVHAFSVFALTPASGGYRLFWGIYVKPVGGITSWYMALIDPFRRFIVYPAALRQIRAAWVRSVAG